MPSISDSNPPGDDYFSRQKIDNERAAQEQAAALSLGASTIGSGGELLVKGSLRVTGSITVPGTLASAGAVTAGTNVVAAGAVSAGTTVTAGGNVNAGADVNAGGNIITGAAGSLFSTYGRATPVVTSYVSAWFNSDGRLGATASSMNVKQDFRPADMAPLVEALRTVALIEFRRIEAVAEYGDDAPVEKGGIVEYFIAHGLAEYCFFDPETGEPQGINYELLTIPLIACFQSLDARLSAAGF